VRCFVRATSDKSVLPSADLEWFYGDIKETQSLQRAMQGVDALANVVSMGGGNGAYIVEAAAAASVKRAVFVSTTSIFTQLNAPSKALRVAAEEAVQTSGIPSTILRPTMIYGSSRDRNMCRLIRYVQQRPVIPIFGSGNYLQQPVYVGDVAQAILDCLLNDDTIGKAYNIPGAEPLTYNQVIDTVTSLMGRKIGKIHLPAHSTAKMLAFFEKNSIHLPFKAEQVMRLNEHKHFDYTEAQKEIGFSPLSFFEGIKLELQEMNIAYS
jgi:nucleoside-diphosphate-sugar epimerase